MSNIASEIFITHFSHEARRFKPDLTIKEQRNHVRTRRANNAKAAKSVG
jgi:hypothetical protein